MSPDEIIAEYQVTSGAQRGTQLTLYANRMELHGGDSMEMLPLAHLASVRVAFEREPRKLNWAIGLLVTALMLASVSAPLQNWMTDLVAKVSAGGGRESLESVLIAGFTAFGSLARLLSPLAGILAAAAIALLAFFWIGRTTLTLAFAATERSCTVRGRDSRLVEFAELVGEQLAARKD
jgi:hypothetical protein